MWDQYSCGGERLLVDVSDTKTFGVEVHAGRKVAGWPFGRLSISNEELTIRSSPLRWIRARSASRDAVGQISVHRWGPLDILKFADASSAFSSVVLVLPVCPTRIVKELREHGYTVTERRPARFPRGIVP